MKRVQLSQGSRATRDSLLLTITPPGVPGTHLIHIGTMKRLVENRATCWF